MNKTSLFTHKQKVKALHVSIKHIIIFFLFVSATNVYAQLKTAACLRGDAGLEFQWRLGYSEFPIDQSSSIDMQDAERGRLNWFDGYLWANEYLNWDREVVQGINLLFRGGTPVARSVRATSEIIPFKLAGKPVTFAIPVQFSIGSEPNLPVALTIKGQTEQTLVINFSPKKQITFTSAHAKVEFHALKINSSKREIPLCTISGIVLIRVYPDLLNYGGRLQFEWNSNTKHMDIESGLVIGSLWLDLSKTDIEKVQSQQGLTNEVFQAAEKHHLLMLEQWNTNAKKMSEQLLAQKGKVTISCSESGIIWDRGERRVQAYSGNPTKDYQFGIANNRSKEIAESVTAALGRKFSLFRYQHHYLLWKENDPNKLDSIQLPYFSNWLKTASTSSDAVMLVLNLAPIMKAYKKASKLGSIRLPPTGIPGFSWEKIKQGYITALSYAKRVCPQLSIIQMPYEFDNISNTEWHKDVHYQFFSSLYEAVAIVNQQLRPEKPLKIAGLGVNNPEIRWDFIEGFLKRYQKDTSLTKRLDYLTWHTYQFPGSAPTMPVGLNKKISTLLSKYGLDTNLTVIVDEAGLAEPTTIEDLSDLMGAAQKEAAMACFSAAIHNWYVKEKGNFVAITGGGWHFGLLTYGKQDVLSPYAKGMVLRSALDDNLIPSGAQPIDKNGYGLYSMATTNTKHIQALVWSVSPAVLFSAADDIQFPQTEVIFKDLPKIYLNRQLKITVRSFSPGDSLYRRVLEQEKFQTLPLTRAADRYDKEFTEQEMNIVNSFNTQVYVAKAEGNKVKVSINVASNSMTLLKVEPL